MPPIADFVCNSPKCRRKDGSAPVYELPIRSTHCPMGHKRIVRLFNKVNIALGARRTEPYDGRHTSSSKAARVDAIAQKPYEEAMAKADQLKAASAAQIKAMRDRTPLIHVVPSNKVQTAMQAAFPNAPAPIMLPPLPQGKAHKGRGEVVTPEAGGFPNQREFTNITARDTEHKLARKADGSLEIKRA